MSKAMLKALPTKNDLLLGYFSQLSNVLYGILMVIFIPAIFNANESVFWFLLLSIFSLTAVVDAGFSSTIVRIVAYIYSGASEISSQGYKKSQNLHDIDRVKLSNVVNLSKYIYTYLSLFVIFIIGVFGSVYFYYFLEDNIIQDGWLVWFVFLLGFFINIYYLYIPPIIMGIGKIGVYHTGMLITRMSRLVLGTFAIVLGESLILLSLSLVVSVVIGRVYLYIKLSDFKMSLNFVHSPKTKNLDVKTLFPNSWKMGLNMAGVFLINQASIFICAAYLSADESMPYIITLQIFGIIFSFSHMYFNNHVPMFATSVVHGYTKDAFVVFKQILGKAVFMFFFAALLIVLLKSVVLNNNVTLHIYLVSNNILWLLILFGSLELAHSFSTTYISTFNIIPFYKAVLVSGIIIVLITLLYASIFQLTIFSVVIIQGVVQLSYNNWKWPRFAYECSKNT